jgi:hypothetical protein
MKEGISKKQIDAFGNRDMEKTGGLANDAMTV